MTRSATSWLARKAPDCHSRASTSVVLPWSTWAMIAMLRMSWRCAIYLLTIDTRSPRPDAGETSDGSLTVAVEPFQLVSTRSVAFWCLVSATSGTPAEAERDRRVWFPRIVAWLESNTRVPERPWSLMWHAAEPWQRSITLECSRRSG